VRIEFVEFEREFFIDFAFLFLKNIRFHSQEQKLDIKKDQQGSGATKALKQISQLNLAI
jgi:hypothetical protein